MLIRSLIEGRFRKTSDCRDRKRGTACHRNRMLRHEPLEDRRLLSVSLDPVPLDAEGVPECIVAEGSAAEVVAPFTELPSFTIDGNNDPTATSEVEVASMIGNLSIEPFSPEDAFDELSELPPLPSMLSSDQGNVESALYTEQQDTGFLLAAGGETRYWIPYDHGYPQWWGGTGPGNDWSTSSAWGSNIGASPPGANDRADFLHIGTGWNQFPHLDASHAVRKVQVVRREDSGSPYGATTIRTNEWGLWVDDEVIVGYDEPAYGKGVLTVDGGTGDGGGGMLVGEVDGDGRFDDYTGRGLLTVNTDDSSLRLINSGQLYADVDLWNGYLWFHNGGGHIHGEVASESDTFISVEAPGVRMGTNMSPNGIWIEGDFYNNGNDVAFQDADLAVMAGNTYISGGALSFDHGVDINDGLLQGHGTVFGRVVGGAGSRIAASAGDLILGQLVPDGFYTEGALDLNGWTVTLVDDDYTQLGSLTDMTDGGVLRAYKGIKTSGTLEGRGNVLPGDTGTKPNFELDANGTITATGTLAFGSNEERVGFVASGPVNVGSHQVQIYGQASFNGGIALDGGSIWTPDMVVNGGGLTGHGWIGPGPYFGLSNIVVEGGDLMLGTYSMPLGVQMFGNIDIGANTLTLCDADYASVIGRITIEGGAIRAANGLNMLSGSIAGDGSVLGAFLASGCQIVVEGGSLSLGRYDLPHGFQSSGPIDVGVNTLFLRDSDFADANGEITIAGGTINTLNGLDIDSGSLRGHGTVGGGGGFRVGSGQVTVEGGDLTLGANFRYDGFESSGPISVGGNTLTLHDSDYAYASGGITIAGGVINAANGLDIGAGSLSGTGTVEGALLVGAGGALLPGAGTGTGILAVGSSAQFSPGADFVVGLKGPDTPGTDYDQLIARNGIELGNGRLDLELALRANTWRQLHDHRQPECRPRGGHI